MTEFYFTQQQNEVAVRLKTDVSVNAWSGSVVFKGQLNGLKIINSGNSDIFWKELPTINGNEVSFAGGIPGGLSGDRVLFQILATGNGTFSFAPNTMAYLNDGLGTQAVSTSTQFNYIGTSSSQSVIDTTPPLPFQISLYHDSSLFSNKPVTIFQAQDTDSGINHYDVSEITKDGQTEWHRAESPYLINSDVTKIEVRAVDNFGNERIESLTISSVPLITYLIIAIGLVFIVALVMYTLHVWRKKHFTH